MVSIVVCTHNRAAALWASLLSLIKQDYAGPYEIIVIDNGSQDATPRVVEQARRLASQPVRYLYEPVLGLSHVRNLGLQTARGEWVAFLDDDAVADRQWLSHLVRAGRDWEAAAVGGKVQGVADETVPAWLSPVLWTVDHAPQAQEVRFPITLPGGNLLARKSVLERMNRFDTHLGREGTRPRTGADIDLCLRLHQAGERLVYAPEAVIYHGLTPDRFAARYWLRRAWIQGRNNSAVAARWRNALPEGVLMKHLAQYSYHLLRSHAARDCREAFFHLIWILSTLGYLYENFLRRFHLAAR